MRHKCCFLIEILLISHFSSVSGVVNLYTTDVCLKENHPKPVKAIMNLVTSATSVTFNPTTEILAVASNEADEAVKLVWSASFLGVTLHLFEK